MSQLGKLYPLNVCSLLSINRTSIKLGEKSPSFHIEKNKINDDDKSSYEFPEVCQKTKTNQNEKPKPLSVN